LGIPVLDLDREKYLLKTCHESVSGPDIKFMFLFASWILLGFLEPGGKLKDASG
jgi:hypothetical protein